MALPVSPHFLRAMEALSAEEREKISRVMDAAKQYPGAQGLLISALQPFVDEPLDTIYDVSPPGAAVRLSKDFGDESRLRDVGHDWNTGARGKATGDVASVLLDLVGLAGPVIGSSARSASMATPAYVGRMRAARASSDALSERVAREAAEARAEAAAKAGAAREARNKRNAARAELDKQDPLLVALAETPDPTPFDPKRYVPGSRSYYTEREARRVVSDGTQYLTPDDLPDMAHIRALREAASAPIPQSARVPSRATAEAEARRRIASSEPIRRPSIERVAASAAAPIAPAAAIAAMSYRAPQQDPPGVTHPTGSQADTPVRRGDPIALLSGPRSPYLIQDPDGSTRPAFSSEMANAAAIFRGVAQDDSPKAQLMLAEGLAALGFPMRGGVMDANGVPAKERESYRALYSFLFEEKAPSDPAEIALLHDALSRLERAYQPPPLDEKTYRDSPQMQMARAADSQLTGARASQAGSASVGDAAVISKGDDGTNSIERAPIIAEGRADVATLQARLADVGLYSGKIDGVVGPITRRAVQSLGELYDERLALPGDARQPDEQALALAMDRASRVFDGDTSVRRLQKMLANVGLYDAPIDGIPGAETREGVNAARASMGLVEMSREDFAAAMKTPRGREELMRELLRSPKE